MSTVKIIDPKVKLEVSTPDAEKVIEKAARTCYKSETKITDESHKTFIKNIIKAGHTSVLEHASATFRIICDRAVTHELVRHRIASYCISGDTEIYSFPSDKRRSTKVRTIRQMYEWQQNKKPYTKSLILRSMNDKHTIVPNKVVKVFFNGYQEVFELITESGRKIQATSNHKFFSNDTWVQLKDLHVGDLIMVNGLELLENEHWLRHNYLTLNRTRKELAQEIGCCEALVHRSFKQFNIVKDKSQYPNRKAGYGVKGMHDTAGRLAISDRMRGSNNPSYKLDRESLSMSGGYCEAHRTIQKHQCEFCGGTDKLEIHHIDKNPRHNSLNNVKILCAACHHAWHKPKTIGTFYDKIVDIKAKGITDVYDLEMNEPYHNYVANGFVVHNCQESQRYVNYKNDVVFIKPSHISNEALDSALEMCNAITFDDPKDLSAEQRSISAWLKSLIVAENTYKELIALGWKPQEARSILPNCTKTEIVVTMNFRSWLNFLELRTSKAAHPDIRIIAELIGKELYKIAPTVFEEYK